MQQTHDKDVSLQVAVDNPVRKGVATLQANAQQPQPMHTSVIIVDLTYDITSI